MIPSAYKNIEVDMSNMFWNVATSTLKKFQNGGK